MKNVIKKQGRRHMQRGMTLLEVIVAMVVLAVGIAGALGAISSCLRNSDAAAAYSHGALLAQQVAAELDRQETLEPGSQSGKFDDQAITYSWQAEISPPTSTGGYPVHATVNWDKGRRHYYLDTVLYPHSLPTAAPATTGTPTGGETPAGGSGGTEPGTITQPSGGSPMPRASGNRREAR